MAELSVFGSVARAEDDGDSDFDLLYVLAPGRHLGFGIDSVEWIIELAGAIDATSP